MKNHQSKILEISTSHGEQSLFFLYDNKDNLTGLTFLYVDDTIGTGTENFLKLLTKIEESFKLRERSFNSFKFSGIFMEQTENKIIFHKNPYLHKLQHLTKDVTISDFSFSSEKSSWLTHTRPYLCCVSSISSQGTSQSFNEHSIKIINKSVTYLHKTNKYYTFHLLRKQNS